MSSDDFFGVDIGKIVSDELLRIENAKKLAEAEVRRQRLEELREKNKRKIKQAAPPISALPVPMPAGSGFHLSEDNDFYHLHYVMYDNKLCTVSWTKKLLESGARHFQQHWIDTTQNTHVKIAPAPLYDACVEHLFKYKDVTDSAQRDIFERVKQMFRDDFDSDKVRVVTSSRIFYKAKNKNSKIKDVVKHNLGYVNEELIMANIQGSDGCVNAGCGFEDTLEAVLKTRDCAGVEQRYDWLTGKKAYLWRLNDVMQDKERAVVLGCYDGRFSINCNYDVDDYRPARGVVVVGAKK